MVSRGLAAFAFFDSAQNDGLVLADSRMSDSSRAVVGKSKCRGLSTAAAKAPPSVEMTVVGWVSGVR